MERLKTWHEELSIDGAVETAFPSNLIIFHFHFELNIYKMQKTLVIQYNSFHLKDHTLGTNMFYIQYSDLSKCEDLIQKTTSDNY